MYIRYKPSFVRDFKKLPPEVQEDAKDKIEQFKNPLNHERLRVHKLKGKLQSFYSFSVTFSHRIVFEYEKSDVVTFLAIGTHDIYR